MQGRQDCKQVEKDAEAVAEVAEVAEAAATGDGSRIVLVSSLSKGGRCQAGRAGERATTGTDRFTLKRLVAWGLGRTSPRWCNGAGVLVGCQLFLDQVVDVSGCRLCRAWKKKFEVERWTE